MRPNLKAFAYLDDIPVNTVASTGFAVLTSKNEINSKYLYNIIYDDRVVSQMIERMGKGAYPSINQNDVGHLKIPLPPLSVQQEIVAEIEGYQKIIDGARQVVELGELCETTSGGTPLRNNKEFYENGNIPWLKSGEVSQGLIYKSEEFITEKGLKNSSAKNLPINSVLIAMYGATAGQIGLLKFEAATNQAICAVFPTQKLIPEFLYLILKSKTENLIKMCLGGAQPNLSQKIIQGIKIPLPHLDVQNQIVARIEEEQKLVDANKKLIELFEGKIKEKIAEVWG